MAKKTASKAAAKDDNSNLFGILTYLFFLVGLIWYLVDENMRKNRFAKFHFKQSLVLVIAYIILQVAAGILFFVPFLGLVVSVLFFVLVILGVINAANREEKELPVIGQFAEKFKF